MDVPAERSGRVSRWRPWCGSYVLRYGFRILLIDLQRGDFDIDHRRFNPRMPHQLHQRWQANTCANNICSECMTTSAGVTLLHPGDTAIVSKKLAKRGRRNT